MTRATPALLVILLIVGWAVGSALPSSAGQIAAASEAVDPLPPYIGNATMESDGTLVLWLRAESGAIVGHGTLRVSPGDPQYEEYKRHIGGIAPGETKPVPRWPDEADPSDAPTQELVPPEP